MEFPDPSKLKDLAASRKKLFKKAMQALKRQKKGEVDRAFHELHETAFSTINCLDCANCCKTTGPLFIDKDIERISSVLNMKPSEFTERYLRIDEDGDFVLKTVPCPFLGSDNYCSIYKDRPRACREYPHTDRKNMKGALNTTLRNTKVCPAVYGIVNELSVKLKK